MRALVFGLVVLVLAAAMVAFVQCATPTTVQDICDLGFVPDGRGLFCAHHGNILVECGLDVKEILERCKTGEIREVTK